MKKPSHRSFSATILAILAILILPGSAIASDPSEGSQSTGAMTESPGNRIERSLAIGFDVVVLRPLAIATLVVGTALLLPTALLAAPGGMEPIREATQLFVSDPYTEAFQRPLGDF